MKEVFTTDRGPKPIGPYSQAVKTNGFLYLSGQVALDPKTNDIKTWKMPKPIGSFAIREKGGAVLALSDGFYLFDFKSGDAKPVGDPVAKPGTQFNDGKTDARGRFIAGTLDSKFAGPLGSIFATAVWWQRHLLRSAGLER